jgi:hypothetical protein
MLSMVAAYLLSVHVRKLSTAYVRMCSKTVTVLQPLQGGPAMLEL